MQPDDLNGVGLILLMVLTAVVIFFYGKLPEKKIPLFVKLLCWIPLGFILGAFAISLFYTYSCDDSGNGPFHQGLVPAFCFALIQIFVPRKKVVLICAIFLFLAGHKLAAQFRFLVNKTGDYTYSNTYTGKPVNQACSADPNAVHPNAVKRWHTPLTRIYRINH